jgi:hypothetical protein
LDPIAVALPDPLPLNLATIHPSLLPQIFRQADPRLAPLVPVAIAAPQDRGSDGDDSLAKTVRQA